MQNFGQQLAAWAIFSYLIDSYRQRAEQAICIPGFITCMVATFYINNWLTETGTGPFFYTVGGIYAAVKLSTLLLSLCKLHLKLFANV